MKACPLAFNHPSEAQQLNGLGPRLCDRLTEKLKAYCEENGLPMPEGPGKGVLIVGPGYQVLSIF
jgi:crossover junction endonuclease MUS81